MNKAARLKPVPSTKPEISRWYEMLVTDGNSAATVLLHPDFLRELDAEVKATGIPPYLAREGLINPQRRVTYLGDARVARKPGMLIRILGWLIRPIIWEAMRQHPNTDGGNSCTGEPMLGLTDAIAGRNRHLGFGS